MTFSDWHRAASAMAALVVLAGCDSVAPSPFEGKLKPLLQSSKPPALSEYISDVNLWTDGRMKFVRSTNFTLSENSKTGFHLNIKDLDLDELERSLANAAQGAAVEVILRCRNDKECVAEHKDDKTAATGKENFLFFVIGAKTAAEQFVSLMKDYRKSVR
jgi:hypothetical protein